MQETSYIETQATNVKNRLFASENDKLGGEAEMCKKCTNAVRNQ